MSVKSTLFSDNTAVHSGGAVSITVGDRNCSEVVVVYVTECTFTQNTAKNGASMFLQSQCSYAHSAKVVLSQCFLTNNTAGSADSEVVSCHYFAIYLNNVNITDNSCRGLYVFGSTVTIHQTVTISNNHAAGENGGGIYMDCFVDSTHSRYSQLVFNQGSHLYIQNNRADKNGGGIYFPNWCDRSCPFTAVNAIQPVVLMANNFAHGAGNSIYGGNLDDCTYSTFWKMQPDCLHRHHQWTHLLCQHSTDHKDCFLSDW